MEITLKVLFPRQIFDLAKNFQRKFDDDHCNDVEKQSNFKKFDCLKADKSAFVETLSVSTFYNHYNAALEPAKYYLRVSIEISPKMWYIRAVAKYLR